MLYEDFLETEDKSANMLIEALQCLKKIRLHDLRSDIIESINNTSFGVEMYIDTNGKTFEIILSPVGENGVSAKVIDVNVTSTENVIVCMTEEQLVSVRCSHTALYTTTEWTLIVCKEHIISNDDIFDKSNLLDNRFQYDTVNPLAGLLLDFWG